MDSAEKPSSKAPHPSANVYRPDTLLDKIYFRKHYTAFVRLVGYKTWTHDALREALEPLTLEFGQDKIDNAADDLLECKFDYSRRCTVERLSEKARTLARSLLGPPPVEVTSAQPQAVSRQQPVAETDGRTESPGADDDDEGTGESDEAEDSPEDYILVTAATALEVEGEPVNLPREAIMTRFVASLDALNMDFGVPDDETKAELHGEYLGTLDYFIDASGETELVTVRPLLTDQQRGEMLAWSELFDSTPMAAFRVWPYEKDGRWTWYWYPIAEDTGNTEPNGVPPTEGDAPPEQSNVRQGESSRAESSEPVDEPESADITGEASDGDDEVTRDTKSSQELHVIITPSSASDIDGRPVHLPRDVVIAHFIQSLDARGVIYNAEDESIRSKLGGERLGTLDYFVYECDDTELVTIRPALTDAERRDMLAWLRLCDQNTTTAFRVWPHEENGRWTWCWYPIEDGPQSLDAGDQSPDATEVQQGSDDQRPVSSDEMSETRVRPEGKLAFRGRFLAQNREAVNESEQHLLVTSDKAMQISDPPVSCPHGEVLTRFRQALEVIQESYYLADDNRLQRWTDNPPGTLDLAIYVERAQTLKLIAVQPVLSAAGRQDLRAWQQVLHGQVAHTALCRVWPHAGKNGWAWHWYPIDADANDDEPEPTSERQTSSETPQPSDVTGATHARQHIAEPDAITPLGEDWSFGDSERRFECFFVAAGREQAIMRSQVPRPRKEVLDKFLTTLDLIRDCPLVVVPSSNLLECAGGSPPTLDVVIDRQDDGSRNLISVRAKHSAKQDQDMQRLCATFSERSEIVRAYRVWPHLRPTGWVWYWFRVSEQSQAKIDESQTASGERQETSGRLPAASVKTPAASSVSASVSAERTDTDGNHDGTGNEEATSERRIPLDPTDTPQSLIDVRQVEHRVDLLAEDLEEVEEQLRQADKTLQSFREELDAIRWQVERATRAEAGVRA